MKLTTLLLLIGCLQVCAKTFSQKLSVSGKNLSLERVFELVKTQTGYDVLYDPVLLRNAKPVSLSVKNLDLETVMDLCLKDQPIDFMIRYNTVVLVKRTKETPVRSENKAGTDDSLRLLIDIKGTIASETGEPLSGASVVIKGTRKGTTTDNDGNFSIEAKPGDILVISMVGYIPEERTIGNRSSVSVSLKLAAKENEQIVVVGYGTQKKIDLSGSVASVSGATLTERPAPNVPNLLQGRIPGLAVVQPGGEIGNDVGSLQIRGLGSYGASSEPLVLIDGIQGTLSNLSPQDIASVTVLKDAASASIYGSRAANGVILVTTKTGKRGTSTLEYSNYIGTTSATRLPDLITNSATYMTMFNQALQRNGQAEVFTQAQIDAYKNGRGDPQYPNMNWLDFYFHSAPIQNHTLSLSGGDDVSAYYVSAGYFNQKGIVDPSGYGHNRYNSQINYTRKINKKVSFGTNTNLSYDEISQPINTGNSTMIAIIAAAPTFSYYVPDGSGRVAIQDYANNPNYFTPYFVRMAQGHASTKNYNINAQGYLNVNMIKGLDWKTTGALVFYNQDYSFRLIPGPIVGHSFHPDASGNYAEYDLNGGNNLQQSSVRNLTLTVNSTLTYQKDLGANHHFRALAGYEQISNTNTNIQGNRYNYTNTVLDVLDAGPTDGWNNNGNANQYALQSGFGRIDYNYKGKYIVQGDIRYDGSSRFAPGNRWSTFGGGSAAWMISEEDFLKNNVPWVNTLKLRGSYGTLGNQLIGNYPYQAVLSSSAYPFGGSLTPGVNSYNLVDPNIRWETTEITDFGIDINIFKGLLGATIDWYNKNTTGILASQSNVPASLGLNAPIINAGAMVNKGWEIQLTHQNHIGGDFTYGANIIFTLNRNKVTQVLNPNPGVFQVGLPYNSFYEYVFDGIFNSQDEIDKSPAQPNSGNLKPGDIKIKDVNGDGQITPDDRVSFSPFPKYTYSFGLNAGYKGFTLSAFFQGVKGQKAQVSLWGWDPFGQGAPPLTRFLNAWTPENHSQTTPAVYVQGYPGVVGYQNTYSLLDASYLRMKNINLSYSFSKKMLKANWLKGLSVFVSGDNLITWTKYPGLDPEGAGGFYTKFPQLKTYGAGLKVTF